MRPAGVEGKLAGRAREVVGAVGVEHGAVLLDLEEEVVDDVFRKLFLVVGLQAENNKETVPAVHFVEAATGDDIGMRKVKQAGRGEFLGAHVAQLENLPRQCDDAEMAALGCG
jgi:hypothetical protein